MSFFKSLAKIARESNQRAHDRTMEREYQQAVYKEQVRNYKDSLECCANCMWFKPWGPGNRLYTCMKHDFCYDIDDVKYNEVHYHKVCSDFSR